MLSRVLTQDMRTSLAPGSPGAGADSAAQSTHHLVDLCPVLVNENQNSLWLHLASGGQGESGLQRDRDWPAGSLQVHSLVLQLTHTKHFTCYHVISQYSLKEN